MVCLPQFSIVQRSFGYSSQRLCFRGMDPTSEYRTEFTSLGISPVWSSMLPCAGASSPSLFQHPDELQLGHWLTPLFIHTQGLKGCFWRPDACSPSPLVCKWLPWALRWLLWSFRGLLGGTLWLEWLAVTAPELWHYQLQVCRKEFLQQPVVLIHSEWLRGTKGNARV